MTRGSFDFFTRKALLSIEPDAIAGPNVPQETLPSAETATPACLGDDHLKF
ncbi:MAG: hypothetical protein ISR59_11845 [Anaerolineales bacterium]|uniref:Uncharacterized protein n=1 Tax=Candidatus Desulfolinea nitratireducens TaxID=2841698 RepID=A0A8J6NKA1_9CHLR|nr:hypothetical protein [Candidatus Desulfolinea nitratireducens]MBL6961791.1 hypothetical protein [Anaerolineales bacterium]